MNRTDLPIAKPCPADWTTMTLAERGRFCGDCRKVVWELERLSEREARALLASARTDDLCVRYVHDATGEIRFRRDDLVPITRLARKAAAVALAVALPIAASACASTGGSSRGSTADTTVLMGAPPMPPMAPDAGAK